MQPVYRADYFMVFMKQTSSWNLKRQGVVYISGKYLEGVLLLHVNWSDSYYTRNTIKQYKELRG
jgi:hypothetical protein